MRKVKRECMQRGKNIKDLCKLDTTNAMKQLFKDLPSRTADFLVAQVHCAARKTKGRRWDYDEKVFALALYKRSPRCYRLLSKFVALPSRRTLSSLLEKVPFNSGINANIFKHLNDLSNSLCKRR